MIDKIKNNTILKTVFDTKNLGLYAVFIIAISVTWSSVKIIQKNYELEKQINQLQQEVGIQEQTNKNQNQRPKSTFVHSPWQKSLLIDLNK